MMPSAPAWRRYLSPMPSRLLRRPSLVVGGWCRRGLGRPRRRPLVLVLRNGLCAPVSKRFRDRVKEAGWLGAW